MTPLTIIRIPGPHGPILRCQGELTLPTLESLRRDLSLLAPTHEGVIVNLTGVRRIDTDGALALAEAARRMDGIGHRLVLAVGSSPAARYLDQIGMDRAVAVRATEEEALALLNGTEHPAPSETWEQIRQRAIGEWETVRSEVGAASPEELIHDLTAMTALCRAAQRAYEQDPSPDLYRCHFCPLFYELGGGRDAVGCRSSIDHLIDHAVARRWPELRAALDEHVAAIGTMALPE